MLLSPVGLVLAFSEARIGHFVVVALGAIFSRRRRQGKVRCDHFAVISGRVFERRAGATHNYEQMCGSTATRTPHEGARVGISSDSRCPMRHRAGVAQAFAAR